MGKIVGALAIKLMSGYCFPMRTNKKIQVHLKMSLIKQ